MGRGKSVEFWIRKARGPYGHSYWTRERRDRYVQYEKPTKGIPPSVNACLACYIEEPLQCVDIQMIIYYVILGGWCSRESGRRRQKSRAKNPVTGL